MNFPPMGSMAVQEILETLFYEMTAEDANLIVEEIGQSVDDDAMSEAVKSGAHVLKNMLIMYWIVQQEEYVERIFAAAWAATLALIRMPKWGKMKGFVMKNGKKIPLVGSVLEGVMSAFTGTQEQRNKQAEIISNQAGHLVAAQANSQNSTNIVKNADLRGDVIEREKVKLQFAESKRQMKVDQLNIKTRLGMFTPQDEVILRKMMQGSGLDFKGDIKQIKAEDMAKCAQYYFTLDTDGNIQGLSETFFQLFNAVGHVKYNNPT